MSSLLHYILVSFTFFFCDVFSEFSVSTWYFHFYCLFSIWRNTFSSFLNKSENTISLFCCPKKESVCALCYWGLCFGFRICCWFFQKTKQTSALHFTTKTIFMFLVVFFIVKKDFVFISWKTLFSSCSTSSFSHLLLTVVRSVVAVTRTSAAGHPLHQAVSFHSFVIWLHFFQGSLCFFIFYDNVLFDVSFWCLSLFLFFFILFSLLFVISSCFRLFWSSLKNLFLFYLFFFDLLSFFLFFCELFLFSTSPFSSISEPFFHPKNLSLLLCTCFSLFFCFFSLKICSLFLVLLSRLFSFFVVYNVFWTFFLLLNVPYFHPKKSCFDLPSKILKRNMFTFLNSFSFQKWFSLFFRLLLVHDFGFSLKKTFCSVPCPLFFFFFCFLFQQKNYFFSSVLSSTIDHFLDLIFCVYFLHLFSFVFFFELSVRLQYFVLLSLFLFFLFFSPCPSFLHDLCFFFLYLSHPKIPPPYFFHLLFFSWSHLFLGPLFFDNIFLQLHSLHLFALHFLLFLFLSFSRFLIPITFSLSTSPFSWSPFCSTPSSWIHFSWTHFSVLPILTSWKSPFVHWFVILFFLSLFWLFFGLNKLPFGKSLFFTSLFSSSFSLFSVRTFFFFLAVFSFL